MKTDTHENLAAGGRWEGGASAETWLKCLLCSGWIGVEILRAVLERVIRITPRRLSQHFKLNTHHNPHLIAITNHISQRNECIKIFLPICKTYRQSTDQMLRYIYNMFMVGILAQNQSFIIYSFVFYVYIILQYMYQNVKINQRRACLCCSWSSPEFDVSFAFSPSFQQDC